MDKLTKFQIALLGVFTFFIVAGVLVFSLYTGGAGKERPQVLVWGVLPESQFSAIYDLPLYRQSGLNIRYVEKDQSIFESEFTNALAEGRGPDLILITHDLLYRAKSKLLIIPFKTYSERDYKNNFIEGTELFLDDDGILGFPILVDPMLMYWNRASFQNVGLARPPQFWEEFPALVKKLTEKDNAGNIRRSAVSLGGYSNIRNAKEIIASLMFQNGVPIVGKGGDGIESVDLSGIQSNQNSLGEATLNFYTSFSNPSSENYSWSKAQSSSDRTFVDGTSAIYLGFSSELLSIRRKNPNLNFDVALLPQPRDLKSKTVFGRFNFLAIPRQNHNQNEAYLVINFLTNPQIIDTLSKISGLSPSRRDLLSQIPTDPYLEIFYQSALISRAFLDPSPNETSKIFADMIEDINSGRETTAGALSEASRSISQLLR